MLSGSMPGMLKRWVRNSRGKWHGLVWVPLGNEDGHIRLTLDDPIMPAAALQCANNQHPRMIQASHRQSEHSAMWQLDSHRGQFGNTGGVRRTVTSPMRSGSPSSGDLVDLEPHPTYGA